MTSTPVFDESDTVVSDPLFDPSRRAFFAGVGALFAAACGWIPSSGQAAQRSYYPDERLFQDFRTVRPLPQASTLTSEIESYVKYLRQTGRIAANEQTAWLVYDFTTRQYLTAINASRPYQSASMVKPFIALAFFHKVREGKLYYTPFHRDRMEAMIQRSDNSATNYFIELLNRTSPHSGPIEAERTLKRNHPGIFATPGLSNGFPVAGAPIATKPRRSTITGFCTRFGMTSFPMRWN